MNFLQKFSTAAALFTGLVVGSADANKADAALILELSGVVSNPGINSIFNTGDVVTLYGDINTGAVDSVTHPSLASLEDIFESFEVMTPVATFQGAGGGLSINGISDQLSFTISPADITSASFPSGESLTTFQITYDDIGLTNDDLMDALMAIVNNPDAGGFGIGLNPTFAGANGSTQTANISIPEPSSFVLLALGGAAAGLAGRRRKLAPSNE